MGDNGGESDRCMGLYYLEYTVVIIETFSKLWQ